MVKKILIAVSILIVAGVSFVERTEIKKRLGLDKEGPTAVASITPELVASPTPTPQEMSYSLVIKNKKLVEGPETITVREGDTVTLKVMSDITDELHLHGYDKSIDLEKDKEGSLTFTANLTGRFVYELEDAKVEIGAIEVQPK